MCCTQWVDYDAHKTADTKTWFSDDVHNLKDPSKKQLHAQSLGAAFRGLLMMPTCSYGLPSQSTHSQRVAFSGLFMMPTSPWIIMHVAFSGLFMKPASPWILKHCSLCTTPNTFASDHVCLNQWVVYDAHNKCQQRLLYVCFQSCLPVSVGCL